jgi:hypothetical protein
MFNVAMVGQEMCLAMLCNVSIGSTSLIGECPYDVAKLEVMKSMVRNVVFVSMVYTQISALNVYASAYPAQYAMRS